MGVGGWVYEWVGVDGWVYECVNECVCAGGGGLRSGCCVFLYCPVEAGPCGVLHYCASICCAAVLWCPCGLNGMGVTKSLCEVVWTEASSYTAVASTRVSASVSTAILVCNGMSAGGTDQINVSEKKLPPIQTNIVPDDVTNAILHAKGVFMPETSAKYCMHIV